LGAEILVNHATLGDPLGKLDVFSPPTVFRLNLEVARKRGLRFDTKIIDGAQELFGSL
jgi:hypothetical protein